MSKQLTVSEALAEGYTRYLFGSDGYQSLKDISEITENHFKREDIYLVNKEPYTPAGLSGEDIAEMLAENIECNHVDQSGDDTEQVYDAVRGMDFSDIAARIDAVLSTLHYYRSSGIKLIP